MSCIPLRDILRRDRTDRTVRKGARRLIGHLFLLKESADCFILKMAVKFPMRVGRKEGFADTQGEGSRVPAMRAVTITAPTADQTGGVL